MATVLGGTLSLWKIPEKSSSRRVKISFLALDFFGGS